MNSKVLSDIEIVSDSVNFSGNVIDVARKDDSLLLVSRPNPQLIMIHFYPSVPFALKAAEFIPDSIDLDFESVQVGNVTCSPFAKRHPVCHPSDKISLLISYRGTKPIQTKVRLTGIGVF
jgi:hypothetical protein